MRCDEDESDRIVELKKKENLLSSRSSIVKRSGLGGRLQWRKDDEVAYPMLVG